MCKSEIFAKILNAVSDETEVPAEQILSNKRDDDTVDARHLLVYLLYNQGFGTSRIAKYIHKDIRCINKILNNFPDRKDNRKLLRIYLESVRNKLGI